MIEYISEMSFYQLLTHISQTWKLFAEQFTKRYLRGTCMHGLKSVTILLLVFVCV